MNYATEGYVTESYGVSMKQNYIFVLLNSDKWMMIIIHRYIFVVFYSVIK